MSGNFVSSQVWQSWSMCFSAIVIWIYPCIVIVRPKIKNSLFGFCDWPTCFGATQNFFLTFLEFFLFFFFFDSVVLALRFITISDISVTSNTVNICMCKIDWTLANNQYRFFKGKLKRLISDRRSFSRDLKLPPVARGKQTGNPKICKRKFAAEENKNIPHKYLIVRYLSATMLIKKKNRGIQHWGLCR